ncbi:MAG TPA: hypothetical protein VNC18_11480 [Gemmatimonadaceae bacterium]|nr:hypothetical protein [Gemmatimonadaceae bacterium]
MIRRGITTVLVALATLAVACIDLSAPKGAASISILQLPSPFVVRGDVMRDSSGAPAKLGVLAYDGNGNLIPDVAADFFITDSGPAAHLSPDGVLLGDRLGTVHVIGQIGNLQTPSTLIPVTVAPTTIARGPGTDTIRAPLGKDSSSSVGSTTISLVARGAGDTTVQGVVVQLKLIRTLESSSSKQPAVYIGDALGKPASSDTTDAAGAANHKKVFVLSRNLADQLLQSGQKIDSVIVEASAIYKGAPLAGSPVRLVIPVRVVPSF